MNNNFNDYLDNHFNSSANSFLKFNKPSAYKKGTFFDNKIIKLEIPSAENFLSDLVSVKNVNDMTYRTEINNNVKQIQFMKNYDSLSGIFGGYDTIREEEKSEHQSEYNDGLNTERANLKGIKSGVRNYPKSALKNK